MYMYLITASKYMEAKLIKRKGETDNPQLQETSACLSQYQRKQVNRKISKDIDDLKNTSNHLNLTYIYRTLYLRTKE